jgi:hypothetical protein
MITLTFVNQATLCHAFFFLSPENYPHKSSAIFHIDLYVFNIHTEIPNGTNKLNHVKWLAVFQNKPFRSHTAERIISAVTRISVCSPLFKTFFTALVLNDFLLLTKGLSLTNWLPFPSFFFGLGVTNNAAKPDCILPTGDNGNAAKPDCVIPTGDDGSLYEGRSSGKPIVI